MKPPCTYYLTTHRAWLWDKIEINAIQDYTVTSHVNNLIYEDLLVQIPGETLYVQQCLRSRLYSCTCSWGRAAIYNFWSIRNWISQRKSCVANGDVSAVCRFAVSGLSRMGYLHLSTIRRPAAWADYFLYTCRCGNEGILVWREVLIACFRQGWVTTEMIRDRFCLCRSGH